MPHHYCYYCQLFPFTLYYCPFLLSITITTLSSFPLLLSLSALSVLPSASAPNVCLNQLQWKVLEGFMMISASIHKIVHLNFVDIFSLCLLFSLCSHQQMFFTFFPIIFSLSAAGRKFPTHKCSTRSHLPQPHPVKCTVLCFAVFKVYSAIIGL